MCPLVEPNLAAGDQVGCRPATQVSADSAWLHSTSYVSQLLLNSWRRHAWRGAGVCGVLAAYEDCDMAVGLSCELTAGQLRVVPCDMTRLQCTHAWSKGQHVRRPDGWRRRRRGCRPDVWSHSSERGAGRHSVLQSVLLRGSCLAVGRIAERTGSLAASRRGRLRVLHG
jgi:hypothetical protein